MDRLIDTKHGETKQALSLRTFLTRLIWLCVVPLIILAIFLGTHRIARLKVRIDEQASGQAMTAMTVVDQELQAQIAALQVLAASPLLDDRSRLKEFYREAQGFRESFGSHLVLADPGTQMLLNTRLPFGAALPRLPRPRGHAAAPAVLQTGKPAVGDMFIGPIAKEPLVTVVVPAFRRGHLQFLLVSTMDMRLFERRLAKIVMPPGWSFTLLDGKNEPMAGAGSAGKDYRHDEPGGAKRFTARSGLSYWSIVLDIAPGTYYSPVIGSVAALLAVILMAAVTSVIAGTMFSRRLGRSVASLAEPQGPDAPYPLLIAEVEKVRTMLSESAAKFKFVFELANVGKSVTLLSGEINVNKAFCDMLGYSPEELKNKRWQDLTPPEEIDAVQKELDLLREGEKKATRFNKRYIRKDGSHMWADVYVAMYYNTEHKPLFFITTVMDITEMVKAHRAVLSEKNKFITILNSLPHGIYISSADCNVEYANPAIEREFGPVNGRKCYEYFHDRDEICSWCKKDEVFTGRSVRWEWYSGKTGKTYDLFDAPVFNQDGTVSKLEIFIDITERKRSEEQIRTSLKEKDVLLKEIQHRVKNNLFTIASILKLQLDRITDKDARDVFLTSINRINALTQIHTRLYESDDFSRIALKEYVEELVLRIARSYLFPPENIRTDIKDVTIDITAAIPLGLIINELVTNSLRHAFAGNGEGVINVSVTEAGAHKILTITDNGIGIPQNARPETPEGLGLQLVAMLAEQLSAEMRVEHGEGTKFVLRFEG